jgi:hypothetical protein
MPEAAAGKGSAAAIPNANSRLVLFPIPDPVFAVSSADAT